MVIVVVVAVVAACLAVFPVGAVCSWLLVAGCWLLVAGCLLPIDLCSEFRVQSLKFRRWFVLPVRGCGSPLVVRGGAFEIVRLLFKNCLRFGNVNVILSVI